MNAFLYTVAEKLYQGYKDQLHRLAVVFPNRRQSVFFKHYFTQIAEPPAFMPQLLTIEELVAQSSLLPVADPLLQSFELYQAYQQVCAAEGDSHIQDYEQFYPIGETLLKDFNEAGAYLVSIAELCRTLHEIESIEKAFEQLTDEQKEFLRNFWESAVHKSAVQEKFLKLWNRLPAIYLLFQQQLKAKGYTTLGMAYENLANNQHSNTHFTQTWSHIAFVGFNAFNKAEQSFLLRWQQENFASLWCDTDEYYLRNRKQEAGFFLRQNEKAGLLNELPPLNTIAQQTRTIEVCAVQGHTAQAKLVAGWLQQLQGNSRSAAILLADESLLLPVLQSLPDDGRKVNVTMGYPLQQTALFSFFSLFFSIQTDLKKQHGRSLHFEQIQQWLDHPFCDWQQERRKELEEKILSKGWIYVPAKAFQKTSMLCDLLTAPLLSTQEAFGRLKQILQLLMQQPGIQADALQQGMITAGWQMLQSAGPLFEQLKPAPSLTFLMQLLRKQLSGISVPFEGEPLQGIQVMGLLESRGLDFEHVLLLGASEGSLPRQSAPQTFLPDSVRRAYGMPVLEFQDSIFAYVFYRLLHRSQSMQLVYNALVSDNSTGEPSRFVQQLEFESGIRFEYGRPGTLVKPAATSVISINKTSEIQRLLYKYLQAERPVTFSASQLNSYLACRLQFFFSKIAGLQKPDEITEEIDAARFGNMVHHIMETLYEKIRQHQQHNTIDLESIKWMRTKATELLPEAFKKIMMPNHEGDIELNGLQQVVLQIVMQYVQGFLDIDEAYIPFSIEHLEVKMRQPFMVEVAGSMRPVYLNGYIDRVDAKEGVYRMVDYKTGSDDPEFTNVEELFKRDGKKPNKAALQTLLYSWMFRQQFPDLEQVEPALLPLRTIRKDKKDVKLYMKENKTHVSAANIAETLEEVEQHLRLLIEEIFDPQVPFSQTEKPETCRYCDFKEICRR